MRSHPEPTKVLYLAGAGRSGGTLLGQIIGQHPNLLYVGELRELWTPGLLVDRLCGCNNKLVDCSFWNEVFESAYGGLKNVDVTWMNTMRLQLTRTRHVPVTWLQGLFHNHSADKLRYAETVAQLYRSLKKTSGREVIVDASRFISYAHILETQPDIRLYVLHLVRDPRAVAFSWTRKRVGTTASRVVQLRQQKPARVAIEWTFQNLFSELSWGRRVTYLRLLYEDFITHPVDNIRRILAWLGEDHMDVDFIHDSDVHLDVCHSAAGNTYRLRTGWVPLKLDDEWKTAMNGRDRTVVNLATWPWGARYGYPLST